MSAVQNERTKLPAVALNDVAVAHVVMGFVTPMTVLSFGIAGAPIMRIDNAIFTVVWSWHGRRTTSRREAVPAEPEAMNDDWLFITFGVPAITLATADAAVIADERAARGLDRPPGA